MSDWVDDLARRLGTVEEGRLGRISRRTTLSKMLGAVIAASPLAAPNLHPQSARAGGKCKKNKDCRRNERCRHGRCERDGDGGGGGNGKWERAGKYSRDEGVDEWKVDRQGGGYVVDFRHSNKNLSGTLDLNYGGGGKTFTMVLKCDNDRFQLAFSGERLSGTDARGRSAIARWDQGRMRWQYDAQSERVFSDSKREFRIALSIASDLAPAVRTATATMDSLSAEQLTASAEVCSTKREKGTNAPYLQAEPEACDNATEDLKQRCRNTSGCNGCCRMVSGCGCICLDPLNILQVGTTNFLCGCDRVGYPFDKICA